MKKVVWGTAIFCWLVFGVYKGYKHFETMDGPSEQVQKIIASVQSGQGWKLTHRNATTLDSENAPIRIKTGLLWASIESTIGYEGVKLTHEDAYWLNKAVQDAWSIYETKHKNNDKEQFDKALERAVENKK